MIISAEGQLQRSGGHGEGHVTANGMAGGSGGLHGELRMIGLDGVIVAWCPTTGQDLVLESGNINDQMWVLGARSTQDYQSSR